MVVDKYILSTTIAINTHKAKDKSQEFIVFKHMQLTKSVFYLYY